MLELVCTGNGMDRTSYRVSNGECRIGRSRDNDIVLDAPVVSGCHAVITADDNRWHLADCSKNGTRVNGKGISSVTLIDGDVIEITPFHLTCTVREEPGAAADTCPFVQPDAVSAGSTAAAGNDGERIPPVRKVLYGIAACGLVGMLIYSLFDTDGGSGVRQDDGFSIPAAGYRRAVEVVSVSEPSAPKRVSAVEVRNETDAMFKLAESLYKDQSQKQNRYRALLTWKEAFKRLEAEQRTPEYTGAHRQMMEEVESYLSSEVERRFLDAKVLVRQRNYPGASVLLREITQLIPNQGDARHQQAARLLVRYRR